MGQGGAKFRTWSGPEGSSHKGPLTSALSHTRCFLFCAGRLGSFQGANFPMTMQVNHPLLT